MIAVTDAANDPAKFASVVKNVVDSAPGVPLILHSMNPSVIEAGLAHCADKKPLIYAATNENADAMAKLAKDKNAPLPFMPMDWTHLPPCLKRLKDSVLRILSLIQAQGGQRICLSIIQ